MKPENRSDRSGKIGNTKILPKPVKKVIKTVQIGQRKNYCFTFNNYEESDILEIITKLDPISNKYVFQEETGENGTRHLQGVVMFKKKSRPTELKLSKKIHWEATNNLDASIDYCQKPESRTGKIYKFGFPLELKIIEELRPWQSQIIELVKLQPDDRTINWVYDETGMNGKTVFSKYLYAKHDSIICTGGGNKDIACLLSILKKDGRDLNKNTSFIFNFPRSTEGVSYKAIESVKDGLMTSVKYESSTLVFNCPHVWIFSNELPELEKISKDRWKLWNIKNDILITYKPKTKYKVNDVDYEFGI